MVYRATCQLCNAQQEAEGIPEQNRIHHQYVGETSRTIRIRSGQHKADYRKCIRENRPATQEEDSWSSFMWDHRITKHEGDTNYDPENDFKFEVFTGYKDSMTRQITEAVMINNTIQNNVQMDNEYKEIKVKSLNRKFECFAPRERMVSRS